jgi:SAM-dependent MidA family methyltransferase
MRAIRFRFAIPAVLIAFAALALAQAPSRQQLENASELHNEIRLVTGSESAVQQFFPSFLEYQDLIMFHPKFGYYGSGRVSFSADYQTYPIVLSPYFGQMIADQIFRMWDGMRQAGSLVPADRFTIAEFGAGDGALAEQILNYMDQKSKRDSRWREFADQTVYICYDRSPALNQSQRKRNSRFGKRFEAREADATEPTATIPPGSLKGVVLSNELPDAFSVHKVILPASGAAEVAYVVPSLPAKEWNKVRNSVPAAVAEQVATDNEAIQGKFFPTRSVDTVYLSRVAFVSLLDSLVSTRVYEASVQPLEFHEVYISTRAIPELAEHLRRYAHLYADELAKNNRGVVTYINLGEEKFVQGAGRILGVGYVMTIDYGANWDGTMTQDRAHLRTYGPAHQAENDHTEPFDTDSDGEPTERDTSDPYKGPTLNDITTDVNFSLMEAEGKMVGLSTSYYGRQKALATGSSASIDVIPAERQGNDALVNEYQSWLKDFKNGDSFKLMIQQKTDTDTAYKYPDAAPQPLSLNENDLTPAQKATAAAIEKVLAAE